MGWLFSSYEKIKISYNGHASLTLLLILLIMRLSEHPCCTPQCQFKSIKQPQMCDQTGKDRNQILCCLIPWCHYSDFMGHCRLEIFYNWYLLDSLTVSLHNLNDRRWQAGNRGLWIVFEKTCSILTSHMSLQCIADIENNVCTRVTNRFSAHERFFCVYFPSCKATREINTKITLELVQKRFVTRVHTLFNFLHDITNP